MRTLATEVKNHNGEEIEISGWVHRVRELGKVSFIIVRDRSGMVQLVTLEKLTLTNESVITVTGTVKPNEKAPGGFEIEVKEIKVLAAADPELPFPVNQDPEHSGIETILDNRYISLRNPKLLSIFRVQAAIIKYFSDFLRDNDFTEIKTSKLIGNGTEGGTNLFTVEYFDTKVYLAQSPQFYKQAMVSSGLERVFEVAPAYRAEKHETARHINEYISLDIEMGFIDSEEPLMAIEREALAYIFKNLAKNNQADFDAWGASIPDYKLVQKAPCITHDEAKKIIAERSGKRAFEINPEGEKVIAAWAKEQSGIELVFINEFPRKKRPFYTFPKGKKTMSFDVVFRGLEITTGGRRINEYPMLLEALPKFGMTEEELGDYMSIFKFGCPPHGGFAIGLERLTQKLLGLANVKEASLFPRDRKRITP